MQTYISLISFIETENFVVWYHWNSFFSPTDVICKEFIFQNDPENCIFLYNAVW